MRANRPIRVLVVLLAVSLLPATAAIAAHEPQAEDVIAAAQSLFMECFADPGQERCLGSSQAGPRDAYITPEAGPLKELTTHATALQGRTGWTMYIDDQSFNTTLHDVGCADFKAVDAFMAEVGTASAGSKTVGPKVVGECSIKGSLFVTQTAPAYYEITSTLLPSAFSPTPSPTPTPKPTATPTTRPTATPTTRPTATQNAAATPTASGSASSSESASSNASTSASATASGSATPSQSAEQTVGGIAFTPEPSSGPGAPAGGGDDWAGSVPSASEVSTDAATLAGSGLAALLLLLAMGFIGELFNNTFETNYDRILAGWQKSWLGRLGRRFSGLWGGGS